MSQPAPLPPPQSAEGIIWTETTAPDITWSGGLTPPVTVVYQPPRRLRSEQVILEAPMSFTGAARRSWRLTRGPAAVKLFTVPLALMVIAVWWSVVACWYGVFLIPALIWRPLFGRRHRRAKRDAMRHRELVEASRRRR